MTQENRNNNLEADPYRGQPCVTSTNPIEGIDSHLDITVKEENKGDLGIAGAF